MRAKQTVSPNGISPFDLGAVTAANFVERSVEFMRRSGRRDGEHIVVRRGEDAFADWLGFLEQIGVPTKAARHIGVMTVPARLPIDFSADAQHARTWAPS